MQVASPDRRILMFGGPLHNVHIDASVGHPGQGGVPLPLPDCGVRRVWHEGCWRRRARPAFVRC